MTWFVPSPILVQPSSLTFRRRSQRIVSTCFLCSSALKKVPQKLTQFALMMSHHCLFDKFIWLFYEMWFGIWFSGFEKNAKTCWDGLDKMPTKKLGRTLWLALCPVGILSYHLTHRLFTHLIVCIYETSFCVFLVCNDGMWCNEERWHHVLQMDNKNNDAHDEKYWCGNITILKGLRHDKIRVTQNRGSGPDVRVLHAGRHVCISICHWKHNDSSGLNLYNEVWFTNIFRLTRTIEEWYW